MECRAVLVWGWLLLGCSWGPGPFGVGAAALSTATYELDDSYGLGRQFDGIGAVSGGGVSGSGGLGAGVLGSCCLRSCCAAPRGGGFHGHLGGEFLQCERSVASVQPLDVSVREPCWLVGGSEEAVRKT